MYEKALKGMVDWAGQKAVQRQDPTGHAGEGKAGCAEDDGDSLGCGYADAPH